MWISGKRPAHITAKIVIPSAERLIEVRHFWRKSRRMAEIRVPAWPMPIQKTKLVMSKAQPTVLFKPQVPMPVAISQEAAATPQPRASAAAAKQAHQPRVGRAV